MQRALPLHGAAPATPTRIPLLAKGFRPFFLLAAAFACAIVPIWIAMLTGQLALAPHIEPAVWHAHEMVFGYGVAVVAGFLLTAVGNWTGRETATGAPLLALGATWTLGRVAMAAGAALPRAVPALVDLAFLPALIVVLARPIIAAKNMRNVVMVAVLGALLVANAFVHLEALGFAPPGSARHACLVGVDVLIFVTLIIAGRVFPMFTRNATGVASIRSIPVLDAATAIGMLVLTIADVFAPATRAVDAIAGITGVLAIARAWHWGTRHVARHPLLWILHVGYAWIPIGLLLRALTLTPFSVWSSLATHALTAGALGSLTLGMMARVSLGHTGRTLQASPRITAAFVLIVVAGVARVFVPMVAMRAYTASLVVAAAAWALAFGLFLGFYARVLVSPRVDGKPG